MHELAVDRFAVGIVALPCKEQVTGQYSGASYKTRLASVAEKFGFFVVDPTPALADAEKRSELFGSACKRFELGAPLGQLTLVPA